MISEEAKKLAEQNFKLIYSFANHYQLDLEGIDDYFGILADALCRACEKYDPSIGNISTFVYKYMRYEMLHCITSNKRGKRSALILPLDDEILDAEWVGDFAERVCEQVVASDRLNHLISLCDDKQREYLKLASAGLTNVEIAERWGCAYHVVKNMKRKIKELYRGSKLNDQAEEDN